MGLDSVELLLEVEKTFDIRIPDREAEQIITVGDFHNSVWNHLTDRHSDKCNSQIIFYKLRSYFINTIGIERNSFKPDTLLNDIFPEKDRRKAYADLQYRIRLTLPSLVLTKFWNTFLHIVGLVSIPGTLLYALFMAEIFNQTKWLYILPLAGIMFTFLVSNLLNFKRIIIHPLTVKGFTEKTLTLNFLSLPAGTGTNRREVEMVINQVIMDVSGLDIEEITPEKKIGDDLGIS